MKRREFIKTTGLAAAGTWLVPQFLKALEGTVNQNGRILVVVQLGGGNDGLNTIIPYRNDLYYELRPQIAVPKKEVLKVSDELGMNPSLAPLRELYDEGMLGIVNNVGYPNPVRSHFKSMDIWHSGHREGAMATGWIGRYMDAECSGEGCARMAVEVDDLLSLAVKGERVKGLAVKHPEKVFEVTRDPMLQSSAAWYNSQHRDHQHENVDYLYKTLIETLSSAQYLREKGKAYRSTLDYPKVEIGRCLKTIAELIIAGSDTSVYYCDHTGFDTHNNQRKRQEPLLDKYARALSTFMKDLKKNNRHKDVLVLTFSEFGRRVKSNASRGTDHGAANNLFVTGGALKNAGFLNAGPDLEDLDRGDIRHTVDFRQVYATLLKKWLGADDTAILGEKFKHLNFI